MIDVQGVLTDLNGPLALLVIMAIGFAECGLLFGFFLPGDSLLFTTGVLLASKIIDLPFLIVAIGIVFAVVLGAQVGYLIGRKIGPKIFKKEKSRFFSPKNVSKANDFFLKNGPKAIIIARFMPVVRTFIPTIAGVANMDYRKFIIYNIVGGVLWVISLLTAGYLLGGISFVANNVEAFTLGIVALSLMPAIFAIVKSRIALKNSTNKG